MENLLLFLLQHQGAFVAVWAGFVASLGCASILYRILKGNGLFLRPRGEVLFQERFGSGRSHRNLLTKLGGAQNCLLVTVSDRELLVRPWIPFNLFFMPEIYDLEHRIPIAEISGIVERRSWLGQGLVDIEFQTSAGERRRFTLSLRKKEEFLQALRKAQLPGSSVTPGDRGTGR